MFTWRDLARIAKKVFTRAPATELELQDYLYVLLYLTTASRGIFRGFDMEPGSRSMAASYLVLVEAIGSLTRAMDLFPQRAKERVANLVREILSVGVGDIEIVPTRGGN